MQQQQPDYCAKRIYVFCGSRLQICSTRGPFTWVAHYRRAKKGALLIDRDREADNSEDTYKKTNWGLTHTVQ